MKFAIKNRFTSAVMFECELSVELETASVSLQMGFAVKAAVKAGANLADAYLARANLARANLADANLADAYLADAYLADANLADAYLAGANLARANLARANLARANLADANLADANLADANLAGAYLARANLARANLADANLADAYLAGAYLADAYLADANLADANLAGANLADANLAGANLTPIRDDLWAVLSSSPKEVVALRQALIDGKVDGSTYSGECSCLVGTLATARHCGINEIPGLKPDSSRPAESFFTTIHPGDTPDKSASALIALAWTDEWLFNMRAAFGPEPSAVSSQKEQP